MDTRGYSIRNRGWGWGIGGLECPRFFDAPWKFKMTPEDDGFQVPNLLFQGLMFMEPMLNLRGVDFLEDASVEMAERTLGFE